MSRTPGSVPYNNRFFSLSDSNDSPVTSPRIQSVSEGVDMYGHHVSPQSPRGVVQGSRPADWDPADRRGHAHRMTSFEHPVPVSREFSLDQPPGVDPPSKPMAPGKPRRLSRQISADLKRQHFAASRTGAAAGSGEGTGQIVTSLDSGCDDVFVEVAGTPETAAPGAKRPSLLPDTSLFRSKSTVEIILSTSSSASMLPNPYNRINHKIHGALWCCSCFYLVFFCCLPAIHYMEQSDVHYNRNNHKRAKSLGRTASFLFFTGSLIAVSLLSLIFFLAIFFAVYN